MKFPSLQMVKSQAHGLLSEFELRACVFFCFGSADPLRFERLWGALGGGHRYRSFKDCAGTSLTAFP